MTTRVFELPFWSEWPSFIAEENSSHPNNPLLYWSIKLTTNFLSRGTVFLNPKNLKDKKKYIIEQTWTLRSFHSNWFNYMKCLQTNLLDSSCCLPTMSFHNFCHVPIICRNVNITLQRHEVIQCSHLWWTILKEPQVRWFQQCLFSDLCL